MQEGLSSNKVAGSPTMTRATSGGPSSSGPEPRVTSHSTPGIPPSAEPQTPGFGRGRGRGGPVRNACILYIHILELIFCELALVRQFHGPPPGLPQGGRQSQLIRVLGQILRRNRAE